MPEEHFHITDVLPQKFEYGNIHIPTGKIIEDGVLLPPTKRFVCHVSKDDVLRVVEEELMNASWHNDHKAWDAINKIYEGVREMDCPWYLGFQATEKCLKTCPITDENRDSSICPKSASADDCYLDET